MRKTRNKAAVNPTVLKMRQGLMSFRKRVDIQCWHPEHVRKIPAILREYADKIERISQSNDLLGHDKAVYAQQQISMMNWDFGRMLPKDPRERGASQMGHTGGRTYYVDENGLDELQAREDLDEPLQRPKDRSDG